MAPGRVLRRPAAVLAAVAGLTLLVATPASGAEAAGAVSGVDTTRIPALAGESLPLITELVAQGCPELPPVWVVAQVEAESGWDPGLHSDRPDGAAGLLQFGRRNWIAAGGQPWPSDPPADGSEVLTAGAHLRIALPWVCANLRAVTAHLAATHKTAAPLDAMLVCHIAGCGRVTGSRTGIPAAGEADCRERCAQVVHRYLMAVHRNIARYTAPAAVPAQPAPAPARPVVPAPASAPAPWAGGATGCRPPDPTGGRCLTGATRHGLEAVAAAFGGWTGGPVVRSTGCWDPHAWNPASDHAKGRACDFMVTKPHTFASGAELDGGWKLANWLRVNAEPLKIAYLIWQGRYWDPQVEDDPGNWGERYDGGAVYDVRDATGGHYDHVHASFEE